MISDKENNQTISKTFCYSKACYIINIQLLSSGNSVFKKLKTAKIIWNSD